MLCLSWWLFAVLLLGTAALGFIVHFAWQWWLLSRPGAQS